MSKQRFSQVVVVLAGFDEQVSLYVRLHLLHRGDKVVIPPINLQENKEKEIARANMFVPLISFHDDVYPYRIG